MYIKLDKLCIQLVTNDRRVHQQLDIVVPGGANYPWRIVNTSPGSSGASVNVVCHLDVVDSIPKVTNSPNYLRTHERFASMNVGSLSISQSEEEINMFFSEGAAVKISSVDNAEAHIDTIRTFVTSDLLRQQRVEDLLFAGLAPVLRRHGYFLVHAFAVTRHDQAILFIGPSGSGKTTTGLKLLQAGYGYLANDVILLHRNEDGIVALPTPGGISLSPETARLISWHLLAESIKERPEHWAKAYVPATRFISSWSEPAPVTKIYFPQIMNDDDIGLEKLNKAVSLAKVMESSVDRWDVPCLQTHLDFLMDLVDQSDTFLLSLASDVSELPTLLDTT